MPKPQKVARKRTQALGIARSRKLVRDGDNRSGGQAQKAGRAGLKAEQELRARRVPAKRAYGPVTGVAREDFGPVRKADEQDPLYLGHHRYMIRTFWWTLLWLVLTAPLWLLIIPGWIAYIVIGLWYLYRCIRGWIRFNDNQPAP